MKGHTLVFDAVALRRMREDAGLTCAEVAHATGLNADGVEAAEDPNRLTMVNRRVLEGLAGLYGERPRALYRTVRGRNVGDVPKSRGGGGPRR